MSVIKYIRLYSDLHLEFGPFMVPEMDTDNETLLILAGDITVYPFSQIWFAQLVKRFAKIIYVLGNHEYYRGHIIKTREIIDETFSEEFFTDKIEVVDSARKIELNGLRILAGTLWTDAGKGDISVISAIKYGMNDFRLITGSNGYPLHPNETMAIFDKTVEQFKQWLNEPFDGKTLIVTHHLPTYQAIDPIFKEDYHRLNGGYASSLDNLILDHEPDYWFFGHSHMSNNFHLGKTHLMSNPRGYVNKNGDPENKQFDPNFLIEL